MRFIHIELITRSTSKVDRVTSTYTCCTWCPISKVHWV